MQSEIFQSENNKQYPQYYYYCTMVRLLLVNQLRKITEIIKIIFLAQFDCRTFSWISNYTFSNNFRHLLSKYKTIRSFVPRSLRRSTRHRSCSPPPKIFLINKKNIPAAKFSSNPIELGTPSNQPNISSTCYQQSCEVWRVVPSRRPRNYPPHPI